MNCNPPTSAGGFKIGVNNGEAAGQTWPMPMCIGSPVGGASMRDGAFGNGKSGWGLPSPFQTVR
jgi:hypothetical protein